MTSRGTRPMLTDKPLLLLMDGHALVRRAWHAFREPLNVRATGEEVTAVYGFMNIFLRALSDWRPTHTAITFDVSAPTFRHVEYDQYKAQRPPTPPELRPQFARVHQLMEAMEVPVFEMAGFEADDLLGTLCRQAEEQDMETLVLTGDSDILQLVTPWVRVLLSYSVQKSTVYDVAGVKARYEGLGPELVPDIKALQGDTSDNIPGVPRVGAKSAIKLLNTFGSLEGIYESIDQVTPAGIQKSLSENRDQAFQGKMLTTIRRDVPVKLDLDACVVHQFERAKVVDLMREMEFFSMVARLPGGQTAPASDGQQLALEPSTAPEAEAPTRSQGDYTVVDTEAALDDMIKSLSASGRFSFDTETTSKVATSARLVGLSFSIAEGKGWYVPVGHDEGTQLPMDAVLDKLRPLFESEEVGKAAHNANFDLTVLEVHGVKVRNLVFDTMLAAHLTGRKSIGLKALALESFKEEMTDITELIGTGRKQVTMAQVPIEKATDYAGADADFTHRLLGAFEKELEDKRIRDAFNSVEMPLVPVLVRMQRNGVALDAALLEEMSVELGEQLAGIEAGMFDVVGHEFNISSSQQLADVLFKELRLPNTKRTKTGFSTDASSLEDLKGMMDAGKVENADSRSYEVLDRILDYRQVSKIKSTYVDSLPTLVNPATGRIHTSYNQTGSATGRVSSNDPNVQNIPVRTELGRRVRQAFVAEGAPEWTLLAADYSQIELRVLAHWCQDPGLLKAFHNGEDIHAATASSVYGVPMGEVTAEMRRVAKIMNFGVLYGLSSYGIARQTSFSPSEGAEFIETYFSSYPGIRTYVDSIKAEVKEQGFVQTLIGRRRYIPEAKSSNFNIRSAGERMAINMPIQGTAADIIKIAMVRIQDRMDELSMRSRMIIQVHDELIFEVPSEELDQMRDVVLDLMPSAMTLAVPLDVELKSGPTWGDME